MKRVLVIDDLSEVRELVVAVLDSQGFQVVGAPDGLTGVELAKRQLPDLILCDVHMPGMDGFAVISELRRDPATATIPFIFLSGAVEKSNMRQGMTLGADDYLTKPFTFEELLGAVNSRLKQREAAQQITEKKLDDLRGNISLALPHELLTPLHGIMGLTALMMEDYQTIKPTEVRDYAKNIHDAGERLNRLIENFLTYSRIELVAADPAKVEAIRQGASSPTGDVLRDVGQRLAEKHGRANDLLLQADDATVQVQPEHFHKIVEELLDNAFKFSPRGTPVRVVALPRQKQLELTITDKGRGLTAEQISRIGAHMQFDRKYYEQQGSGLGLIIAKRLAEVYNGRLTVQSNPGQNTTVTVLLPISS